MADRTFYYRHEGGSYSVRTVNYEGEVAPPDGAVEITEAEYTEGVAAVEAANAALEAEQRAAEQERFRVDYEALIAAGVPPETAARMSGYNPPHPTVGSAQKTGE
ncbi:hypothetical protein OG978_32855 [Streptomyces sp. NBC_01591]|uniref:hypothetical protein n=1 Tax=Streptomyces sp. NBC_01591 TaxID=2975888 RepID=UPI002DDA69B6|nr:hypothetical protein [Streptomyces sp. NBC_01591]WSD71765.1 hypothetical protein OG978_32855 [Streptomyces sp. NBC_01591]